MDEFRFWEIIQVASSGVTAEADGFGKELRALLKAKLLKLLPDEIMMFRRLFDQRVDLAFSNRLWGAAYLINGGCSDDCFYHFCCWLVGMGKEISEATLRDPDSLADVLDGDWPVFASYAGAAEEAWVERSGQSCEEFYRVLEKLGRIPAENDDEEDDDWDFDDDDEMITRYPRLAQIYMDGE